MQIDTSSIHSEASTGVLQCPHTSALDNAELVTTERALPVRGDDFTAILEHLDGVFKPLLDGARVDQPCDTSKTAAQIPQMLELSGAPSPEDIAERDRFLAMLDQGPTPLNDSAYVVLGNEAMTRLAQPRRGVGAPVFVGLDAEWDRHSDGRNKLLSVQFYLIGPTGERLSKVIDVLNGEDRQSRPSLAETLGDLLDEAEAYCIFDEWPSEVILCGFFTRADIPVFRDAGGFVQQLNGINGSLASVANPVKITLSLNEEKVIRLKARHAFIVGGEFDPRVLPVRLIDAKMLAPPGASLAKVGDWIHLPKLKLPAGYTKSEMSRFARERPEAFREYGLRDAEIAVLYVLWVLWFCDRHLGLKGLSATASGLGMRLAQLCIRKDGVHPDVALNYQKVRRWFWAKEKGKPISTTSREPTAIRAWFENFLADAYMGGRNECYWFGPTPVSGEESRLYDHDLAGCYVVSLAGTMVLDYDKIEVVRDKDRYKGHVAGFAQIRFKFPEGTMFPCIPVMVGNYGLWFPLSGVGIATAPEIELAMEMGAEIEILFGVVIPWMDRAEVFSRSQKMLRKKPTKKEEAQRLEWDGDALVPVEEMRFPPEFHGDTGYRSFESFAIYTRTERLRYAKKSLPNEFMKLLGNSAYGKTGQGFKEKRVFAPKEMRSEKVGRSAISEAAVAALTSGFARAVLGEILWKLPPGTLAVSATTDGLLVDVEKLDLTGTMCRRFQSLVDRVAPGTGMTELKHLIGQAVAGKTRLQLTGKVIAGEAPVVAKGGIKVLLDSANGDEEKEKELLTPISQNRFVLDLFINRFPGQVIKRPSSMSSRDQLPNEWDFQVMDREMRLSMEFDFKRRPVNPQMIKIESHDVPHLAFDTVPWKTVEEGALIRVLFDEWRRGDGKDKPGHCLKTMEDWDDWQRFQQLYAGNRLRRQAYQARLEKSDAQSVAAVSSGETPTSDSLQLKSEGPRKVASRCSTGVLYATSKGGYLGIAIRSFLTAYVQRACGLNTGLLSQAKLAAWMTEVGYPTKVHDVKNAGRTVFHEHAVPRSSEVLAFFAVMKGRFPALDVDRFFACEG
nr:hypothetical protein [Comamonas thiooxydans]